MTLWEPVADGLPELLGEFLTDCRNQNGFAFGDILIVISVKWLTPACVSEDGEVIGRACRLCVSWRAFHEEDKGRLNFPCGKAGKYYLINPEMRDDFDGRMW